jgi:hypothetical protein
MISLLDEDPRVAAARITLLALRARLANVETPPNRFRLPDGGRVLEAEPAAITLARIKGPLVLRASVEDGVIHVARSPEEWMARIPRAQPLFRKDARRHGEAYGALPVCCIGAGEALLVTAGALEAWRRGYFIAIPGGTNAGPPSHYLPQHPGVARQAYASGAVGIVLFHFPEGPWPEDTGDVIVLDRARRPDHPRVLEHGPGSAPCALCGTPGAEWRETATWTRPWRVRRLCSACIGARITPLALAKAREMEEWLAELSPRGVREFEPEIALELRGIEAAFRWLRMPPEVRALLDGCRTRLSE